MKKGDKIIYDSNFSYALGYYKYEEDKYSVITLLNGDQHIVPRESITKYSKSLMLILAKKYGCKHNEFETYKSIRT